MKQEIVLLRYTTGKTMCGLGKGVAWIESARGRTRDAHSLVRYQGAARIKTG